MELAVSDTFIAATSIIILLIYMLVCVFLKAVVQPIRQLKKTMADILCTFSRYTNVIHYADVIPPDLHSEAYEKLRRLSNQLYDDMSLISKWFFNFPYFSRVFSLPKEEMVYKSARNLTATTNWMYVQHKSKLNYIVKNIQTACDNLGLYIDPKDRITNKHLNYD